MTPGEIPKILKTIEPRVTRVTIPTALTTNFNRFLARRKIEPVTAAKPDSWNGVESAYTNYDLPIVHDVADLVFDDWIDDIEATLA